MLYCLGVKFSQFHPAFLIWDRKNSNLKKLISAFLGEKDDPSSNYVTLQASPSSDGVEFVTLDEFFVADPSAVYEQIIPPHSPHQNNQNESQNG